MIALFVGLFAKIKIYLFIGLAVAAAVAGALFVARQGGRNAEKVDQLKRELEGVRVRREVEVDVGGDTDDELDDRLRPPARRKLR